MEAARRFYTWAAPCCFKAPVRREGQRIVTRFQLQEVCILACSCCCFFVLQASTPDRPGACKSDPKLWS